MYLSTCQSHTPLSHSMRAGEVQLQSIGTSLLSLLAEFRPVFLRIATHRACNHNLRREERMVVRR